MGEFKNLAPAIKAELPSYFTEKADLEIDYIPAETELENTVEIDGAENEHNTELLTETD